jgi:vacuolar-type H+-ATPase subunit I/STV1
MLKGTKLYSIFTGACPVCHSESMYTSKNLYNINKTQEMHERCSHCNTKYKMEPSFFYGAMYVSYGVGVALAIATFIIAKYLMGLDRLQIFFMIMGIMIIGLPVIIRLSRNIWINLFLNYDKEKANLR